MPTFNFDVKACKRYGKLQERRGIEAVKGIAPTPFSFNYEEVEKQVIIFIGNDNPLTATKQTLKGRKYSAISEAFSLMTPTLSRAAMLIAFYISANLDFNSNIIKLSENNFKSFSGMGATMFKDALKELIRPEVDYQCAGDNCKLLAKTTKQSYYIVNHNFIFKGSIDTFGTLLKDKYPDGCKLDSKGKVILEN